jgi:hypothetical protein
MVESPIVSSTPDLSFDHNLCFRCPNGSWEPILDIYVLIDFQWYKELFKLMGFDPCDRPLKIRKSIWDSNSQNGRSLGRVRVHALTFFCTLKSTRCDSQASFLAHNLANPCLGREPKAKVAIIWLACGEMDNKFYVNVIANIGQIGCWLPLVSWCSLHERFSFMK